MELTLEKVLKLDRSKKIMITAAICMLLVAIYVWLFFLPLRQDIQDRDRRLGSLLSKKAEQEAIVQNLPGFKEECRKLEADFHAAMVQLPNKKEIPTLLQNISNLGRESGLEMPLFKPGQETKKDFYAEVPVELKVVGNYQNLLQFFFLVGNLSRIVTISDLAMLHPQKAEQNQLEAACKAVTYRFLEESERASAEKKNAQPGQKSAAGSGGE